MTGFGFTGRCITFHTGFGFTGHCATFLAVSAFSTGYLRPLAIFSFCLCFIRLLTDSTFRDSGTRISGFCDSIFRVPGTCVPGIPSRFVRFQGLLVICRSLTVFIGYLNPIFTGCCRDRLFLIRLFTGCLVLPFLLVLASFRIAAVNGNIHIALLCRLCRILGNLTVFSYSDQCIVVNRIHRKAVYQPGGAVISRSYLHGRRLALHPHGGILQKSQFFLLRIILEQEGSCQVVKGCRRIVAIP